MVDVLDSDGDISLMSTTSSGISDNQGGGLLSGTEHHGDEARSFWAMILKNRWLVKCHRMTEKGEAHPVVMMSWLLINPTSPPGPPIFSL